MFSKDEKPRPTTPAESARGNGSNSSVPSLISTDLTISGNLRSDGDLQVDGVVDGDINARSLTVGEESRIKGELDCQSVTVRGQVDGTIRAGAVTLTRTARVKGDIIHDASLSIEAGAHFEGQVRRSEKDSSAHSAKPAAKAASSGNGKDAAAESAESAEAAKPA